MAIVGAPFDDAVSHRSGARFGPRAIREAQYTSGSINSLQLGVEPFEVLTVVDAGDANIVPAWIERSHAFIYRKVLEVAEAGALPIVLGGDHSITWPSATAIAEVHRPGSIGIVHFDAHADTAMDDWGVLAGHGTPMRRLVESGAVQGRNFVQVGLRGYWPPVETFEWMREHGLRYHLMTEIEERGAEAVVADAIAEALDGPDHIYLSVDIDVLDPGLAPGTGTPEPGGTAAARAAAGRAPDRRSGRPRRDGHRRGVAAVRPCRDDGDGRQPARARGDQRARRSAQGRDLGPPLVNLEAADPATAAALARLYDLDLADDPGDVDLYRALADRVRGRVLELAVGTGRVAIPLAAAGHRVTGVDNDRHMLDRARARAAAEIAGSGGSLELVEADLVGLALPEGAAFDFGFLALNSLMALGTRTAQQAAIQALADHLVPGGIAAVDVWLPDADDLARYDGGQILEWARPDPTTGAIVTKTGSAQYDAATGTIALTTIFEEGPQGAAAVRWVRSDRLRLVSADELTGFAEAAGLRVETLAGSYDLEAHGPGSERAILVAIRT